MTIDPPTRTHAELASEQAARVAKLAKDYEGVFAPHETRSNAKSIIVNGKRYASATLASEATGIPEPTIRECCRGRRNHYRKDGTYATFTAQYVHPKGTK